jgi:hypothetical protein
MPTHVATLWEERIAAEFMAQAKREMELGLPVAPCMQGLDNMATRAKARAHMHAHTAARLLAGSLACAVDDACVCAVANRLHRLRFVAMVPRSLRAARQWPNARFARAGGRRSCRSSRVFRSVTRCALSV